MGMFVAPSQYILELNNEDIHRPTMKLLLLVTAVFVNLSTAQVGSPIPLDRSWLSIQIHSLMRSVL